MTALPRPAADVHVDETLVQRLLAGQHPDLAALPVRHHDGGWDNEMFRLGAELAVRMPRRAQAAPLLENELTWLGGLAERLPLPVPAPVRRGEPGEGYPYAWAVVPWLPGRRWAEQSPEDEVEAAVLLGGFVAALAVPAPAEAPANPFRGVPLAERDAALGRRLAQWGDRLPVDPAMVRRTWEAALEAPAWSAPPVWLHGDLHPANLLVDGGRPSAVLDFGDLTAGDPATDLSVAWTVLRSRRARDAFREAAGSPDDETWLRARGNALAHGLACVSDGADDPVITAIGLHTLRAAVSDD